MSQTAAVLVDHVLPRVPVRQWVLAVPKRIRWFVQHDRKVASSVLKMFLGEVEKMLRRCSPEAPFEARFGAAQQREAAPLVSQSPKSRGCFGAVAFTQRFGMSLNEHPHFHVLATDGVFVETDDEVRFIEAAELTQEKIEEVETRVRRRVLRWFSRQGLLEATDAEDMLAWEHSGGFSVDGSVLIAGWDRQGLERVVRYCSRPAFSGERFALLQDGKVTYILPKPDLNGRTLLVMDALELLDKLAKLIPPPRTHQVRYFGVMAPNSHMRKRVIESAGPSAALQIRLTEAAQKMGLVKTEESKPKKKASRTWAMLIARIFEVFPLLCLRCHAPMKIVVFITEPNTVTKILEHIGVPSTAPVIAPARAPPQEEFCYDT